MIVQLNNVEFFYANSAKNTVLKIHNWFVADKSKHFLYGASGSGKTSLLNLISGVYRPTSGAVYVLGERLDKMNSRQRDRFRANNMGYIFQQFNLINYLNSIENIKLSNYFSANKHQKNLTQYIYTLLEELGVNSDDWYRPVSTLSVGQQQRIAIARAFINKPKLLIADEATSSLDEHTRDNFMSLLTSLCRANQTTLLFVSHDTRLIKHFDVSQHLSLINLV